MRGATTSSIVLKYGEEERRSSPTSDASVARAEFSDRAYYQLERLRYAAMKLSRGTLGGLRQAIELVKTDWRDLLMGAGFGEDTTEHQRWRPSTHSG